MQRASSSAAEAKESDRLRKQLERKLEETTVRSRQRELRLGSRRTRGDLHSEMVSDLR